MTYLLYNTGSILSLYETGKDSYIQVPLFPGISEGQPGSNLT